MADAENNKEGNHGSSSWLVQNEEVHNVKEPAAYGVTLLPPVALFQPIVWMYAFPAYHLQGIPVSHRELAQPYIHEGNNVAVTSHADQKTKARSKGKTNAQDKRATKCVAQMLRKPNVYISVHDWEDHQDKLRTASMNNNGFICITPVFAQVYNNQLAFNYIESKINSNKFNRIKSTHSKGILVLDSENDVLLGSLHEVTESVMRGEGMPVGSATSPKLMSWIVPIQRGSPADPCYLGSPSDPGKPPDIDERFCKDVLNQIKVHVMRVYVEEMGQWTTVPGEWSRLSHGSQVQVVPVCSGKRIESTVCSAIVALLYLSNLGGPFIVDADQGCNDVGFFVIPPATWPAYPDQQGPLGFQALLDLRRVRLLNRSKLVSGQGLVQAHIFQPSQIEFFLGRGLTLTEENVKLVCGSTTWKTVMSCTAAHSLILILGRDARQTLWESSNTF